jgi:hypothetical protein
LESLGRDAAADAGIPSMRSAHNGLLARHAQCGEQGSGCNPTMTIANTPYRRSWRGRVDPFDLASFILICALVGLVLLTVRDYAISNDEEVQHRYGELILAYYTSGFADRTLFNFSNLYLYGGLFDVVALLMGRVVPLDIFLLRHLLCAATGLGGIVATWAAARMIAGPRAGALAALAIAVCGPWYGAMFNHTKDVPFAAAMIGASFFLLRATRDLPRPRLMDLALFGVLMGAALGQRAMGLLLATYVLLAIALHVPQPFALRPAARFFGRSLVLFAPPFALAYLIMIAAWPWAALGLFNPIHAIFAFAHFQYPVRTLLSGDIFLMAQTPRSYVPIYLAIKLPLLVLVGAALALITIGRLRSDAPTDRLRWRETAFVAATVIVPLLGQVIGHGPAFTGMRHFTFVVPSVAVLAGVGFDRALAWLALRRRGLAGAAFATVALGYLWTAGIMARLHPYQYLSFNALVGGLAGAAQRYDTDYWVNVMHEAVVLLEARLDREGNPGPYFVAVCGERLPFEHEAAVRNRLKWATDADPADFFIAPTHMACNDAVDGEVIIRIERIGTLIGVVKDRRAIASANVARDF